MSEEMDVLHTSVTDAEKIRKLGETDKDMFHSIFGYLAWMMQETDVGNRIIIQSSDGITGEWVVVE